MSENSSFFATCLTAEFFREPSGSTDCLFRNPMPYGNVRLGADSVSKADGQCSNHCVPARRTNVAQLRSVLRSAKWLGSEVSEA